MACLQGNVSVGMKRVKAKVFMQVPFNPMLLTEDANRYVDVSNVVCALTCYNYCKDILEISFSLMCFTTPMKSSLDVAEAGESVEMTETAVDEVQHERIPRRRKRWFESNFFYYE